MVRSVWATGYAGLEAWMASRCHTCIHAWPAAAIAIGEMRWRAPWPAWDVPNVMAGDTPQDPESGRAAPAMRLGWRVPQVIVLIPSFRVVQLSGEGDATTGAASASKEY
jgi:hypothetical protein